jgi:small subunit ribosomal protein S6
MYILDPTLDEDATESLIGQVEEFMAKQGVTVEKTEPWGKRRLAYRIGKHWEGYYVLTHFRSESGVVTELERRLRVTDGVMRFLTVRVDEEQEKLERRRAKKGVPAASRTEERPAPKAEASEPERVEGESKEPAVSEETPGTEGQSAESQADPEPTGEAVKREAESAGEAS